MSESTNTGGVKSFIYTKEDLARIASEDTSSTLEFKKALYEDRTRKEKLRKRAQFWASLEVEEVGL